MLNIYEIAKDRMKSEHIGHHCGDLYLKVTAFSKKLVDEYDYKNQVTTFVSQIDHQLWYDIPFAYLDQYIKDEAEERRRFAEWVMERNQKAEPEKKLNKYRVVLTEIWKSDEVVVEAESEEEATKIAYEDSKYFDVLKSTVSAVDDDMKASLIED